MIGARVSAAAAVLLLTLPAAHATDAPPGQNPSQRLQLAVGQYEQNDYRAAITTIGPLLYPTISLNAADEVLRAHRILGISYYMIGDTARAESEFQAVLALEPTYHMDPAVDPAEAVNFFEQVRRKDQEQIAAEQEQNRRQQEEKAREEQELRQRMRERVVIVQRLEHVPFGLTLVPFGVGQFAENRHGAGWFFLSSEAALGVTSAVIYAWLALEYPAGTRPPPADLPSIHDREVVQVASGSLCLVLALAGVVDAVYHYEPDVLIQQTERVVPGPASGPALKSLLVVPFATLSGGGLAVGGTF